MERHMPQGVARKGSSRNLSPALLLAKEVFQGGPWAGYLLQKVTVNS